MFDEIKKNIRIVWLVLIVSLAGLIFFVIMANSLGNSLGIIALTVLVVSCINGLITLLNKKKTFINWSNDLDENEKN